MKIKQYTVYKSGSAERSTVYDTCITKAAKQFIKTLDRAASYILENKIIATIRYTSNYTILSDYIIVELQDTPARRIAGQGGRYAKH